MIRVRQIKLPILEEEKLQEEVARKLRVKTHSIKKIIIKKRAIDAREKPNLYYSYVVDVLVDNEKDVLRRSHSTDILKSPNEEYVFPKMGEVILRSRPVIVGCGPSGLFCSYLLASLGYRPIVYERGEKIEMRIKSVEEFFKTGILNPLSNVQFGEGGAGTFSDGKLNTLVKDPRNLQKYIFQIFVENGAPREIMYEKNPHIGTDLLRVVIKNIRKKIEAMGGEFHFQSQLTDIKIENDRLSKIEINHEKWLDTDVLVLAIGHSARDTFRMLYEKKFIIDAKPFAVGFRISHPQKLINLSQYGQEEVKKLGPATYKLTYQTKEKRGVYTFCTCPGGYIINASSEKGRLAVNGMSNYKRDSKRINSAVIVTIGKKDFGEGPLDGVKYQEKIEELAYKLGNGKIPIQRYQDFKKNKKTDLIKGDLEIKGLYQFTNLRGILKEELNQSLIEGIEAFSKRIVGFNNYDAFLAGIESRTSSPIKVFRDEEFLSNYQGIYPCGEGCGYAGGITSAGMDGIRVAEAIIKKYNTEGI